MSEEGRYRDFVTTCLPINPHHQHLNRPRHRLVNWNSIQGESQNFPSILMDGRNWLIDFLFVSDRMREGHPKTEHRGQGHSGRIEWRFQASPNDFSRCQQQQQQSGRAAAAAPPTSSQESSGHSAAHGLQAYATGSRLSRPQSSKGHFVSPNVVSFSVLVSNVFLFPSCSRLPTGCCK